MFHPADALLEEILRFVKPYPRVRGSYSKWDRRIDISLSIEVTTKYPCIMLTFFPERLVILTGKWDPRSYYYCDPDSFIPEKIGEFVSQAIRLRLEESRQRGHPTMLDGCFGFQI